MPQKPESSSHLLTTPLQNHSLYFSSSTHTHTNQRAELSLNPQSDNYWLPKERSALWQKTSFLKLPTLVQNLTSKTFREVSEPHKDYITEMLQTGSDVLGKTIIDFSIVFGVKRQNPHIPMNNVMNGWESLLTLHFPNDTNLPSVHEVAKKMQSKVLLSWSIQLLRKGLQRYEVWHTSQPAKRKQKTTTGLSLETFLQG